MLIVPGGGRAEEQQGQLSIHIQGASVTKEYDCKVTQSIMCALWACNTFDSLLCSDPPDLSAVLSKTILLLGRELCDMRRRFFCLCGVCGASTVQG